MIIIILEIKEIKNNEENIYRNNYEISSIYSDIFLSGEKNNKSISANNGYYNHKKRLKIV